MIDFIVRMIFKVPSLRLAIFDEVNWYNSLGLIFEDPEAMKTAATFWWEPDGWRGWVQKDSGMLYFHDIPEPSISDIISITNREENNEA